MIYNNDNLKIVRTSLKDGERSSVLFLMKHFNQDTPQSLIRFLITKEYQDIKDTQLKYKPAPTKETYADKVIRLKAMSPEELQAHLLAVGYMEADHPEQGNEDIILQERIEERDGNMVYIQQRYSQLRSKVEYSREIHLNIDEIIRGLVKEKLI